MHAVNSSREAIGRQRTHTASGGQVLASQPKTMQAPPGWDVSQTRSPVIEQFSALAQGSPMPGVHPAKSAPSATKRRVQERMGGAA